uniref:MarR family winged helix-turn-helix transcriptional regulator n=1 Tax=Altererythrobacter segetis TaxID=1104773 RepID=UPI0014087051|nr:helix-turn-helix domain-containing protein [Altererythrobacter segetis]
MTKLSDGDYQTLAGFRYALRRFGRYSEAAAEEAGLTPRQHQALLAIRAGPGGTLRVGELAERLFLRPHSASELVQRMEEQGLLQRETGPADKRQVAVRLHERGKRVLEELSQSHRAELRRLRPMLQELLAELG